MGALLLSPHNLGDDETLFAAFIGLQHQAHVVTVLRSVKQEAYGITADERERESGNAMAILGLGWQQWGFPDVDPPWDQVERRIAEMALPEYGFDAVFAPAVEDGGHEHHSIVGEIAGRVFGDRCRFYTTYRRGQGRTVGAVRVEPEPDWIILKLRALSCFESQIREPSCRPWFLGGLDEWWSA